MNCLSDLSGVFANAVRAKIRGESSDHLDLGYLYVPACTACSVFGTRNHFRSSSVTVSLEHASKAIPKVLIVNSGNSNAVTGKGGEENTRKIISLAANVFNVSDIEVLNASTGIIGVPLPMHKIQSSFPSLTENIRLSRGDLLQKAILTTDLVEKFAYSVKSVRNKDIIAAGIAKGSGMIAPNMGTMFAFIVINFPIKKNVLDSMMKEIVDTTFNMMSVDTDTSTSDMVVVFANGDGEKERDIDSDEHDACRQVLEDVCVSLSTQIAKDGEGASKLLTVHVKGSKTIDDARRIAKAVSDSPLVKTAVHGADPNWGRVLMAIGKQPEVIVVPECVSVSFGSYAVFQYGEPVSFDRELLRQYLSESEVVIHIDLGAGSESAVSYGCDLTKGYIDINTCYN
jgi:glutamate N-acetyltransferase / amino-acid N-acetyltransferase